ncbi:MAG: enoyl-CoA hydratase/isomerase family protein [Myxococcaceae bacterium]|nr:enoyl-CoA hydratase/isomerase family protein [Myxococcaceae bacterium]
MDLERNELMNGQVIELLIATPPANIVSERVIVALDAALREAAARPGVKLIILSGKGDHFSYGASVEEHQAPAVNAMLPKFHQLIGTILELPVPTLARVSGRCFGGGFEVAMACSLVMVDETVSMGVPEVKLGVFPPVAAALLGALIPGARAAELVLTGRACDAAELSRLGLANEVAPKGKLAEVVAGFLEKHILPQSAAALRQANRAARLGLVKRYRELIGELEHQYLVELMATKDANEGIKAFIEKRRPTWSNA